MLPILFLGLFNIEFGAAFNDFPSLIIANASMAVVIERPFFEIKAVKKRHSTQNAYEKKLEALIKSIKEASKSRGNNSGVGIEISVFEETSVNLARDHDCPRLPIEDGISVPIVEPGQELPQIFLDLRMDRVLTWTRINVLHDRVLDRDSVSRVLRALTGEIPNNPRLGLATKCLFSVRSTKNSSSMKKSSIIDILNGFPPRRRSNDNFLIIVNHGLVPTIIESARSLGLLHTESQWLFVLPDSAEFASNVTGFRKLLGEGENISFIYNKTNFDQNCQKGLECHVKELVRAFASGITEALSQEIELYNKVTEEEFDDVRMSKTERRRQIVSYIRKKLRDNVRDNMREKKCDICMNWKTLAGITWGNYFGDENATDAHKLIDAGQWTPGIGSLTTDLIFPHTKYAFRNKTLPIVTYQNPPWQYLTESKESGKLKWDGLVFDILDELSKKLNFTYKLIELGTTTMSSERKNTKSGNFGNHSDVRIEEFIRALTSSGKKMPEAVTKLVHESKVLMAACASTITERLKSSINFTVPISVQTYSLLAIRPKPLSRAMLFASPYTTEVQKLPRLLLGIWKKSDSSDSF